MGLLLSTITIVDLIKYSTDRTISMPDGTVETINGNPYISGIGITSTCILYGFYSYYTRNMIVDVPFLEKKN